MFEFQKTKKWLEELREKRPTVYFFADLGINIIVVVLLVYVVRTYLISPFQVFGPSMCDNLNNIHSVCQEGFGEYLIVNKAIYYPFFGRRFQQPQRGDIVVFLPPHNSQDFYIKRIIGIPGEKIKLQNGKVFVTNKNFPNGLEIKEPYLNSDNKNETYALPSHLVTTYEIPEGTYFVLGDNRKKSTDSRMCFRGIGDRECDNPSNHFLPIERIEGKAWMVLWPFNQIRILKNPLYNGI